MDSRPPQGELSGRLADCLSFVWPGAGSVFQLFRWAQARFLWIYGLPDSLVNLHHFSGLLLIQRTKIRVLLFLV